MLTLNQKTRQRHRLRRRCYFFAVKAIIGANFCAQAEENSILDTATLSSDEVFWTWTGGPRALINGNFSTSFMASLNDPSLRRSDESYALQIELGTSRRPLIAFLQNRCENPLWIARLGETEFWVSDTAFSFPQSTDWLGSPGDYGFTLAKAPIFDTGFHDFETPFDAEFFLQFRKTKGGGVAQDYDTKQLRLYETPNLIQRFGAQIMEAPTAVSSDLGPSNLIESFDSRTSCQVHAATGAVAHPLTGLDWSGTDVDTSRRSCFTTNETLLSAQDHLYVLSIKMDQPYFVHAILLVQDIYDWYPTFSIREETWFQNIRLFIGNYADWTLNPECENGPFMTTSDPNSYTEDSVYDRETANNNPLLWKHGLEEWCNMEGQYVQIVADLSHMAGQYSSSVLSEYEISLCSLGIMGTKYVRDEPVPDTLTVLAGQSLNTLDILKVYSEIKIGTILDIKLRQVAGQELSFVTFDEQGQDVTKVIVDGTNLVDGDQYDLQLESYDSAGSVQSALKTDTIKVIVASNCKTTTSLVDQVSANLEQLTEPIKLELDIDQDWALESLADRFEQAMGLLQLDADCKGSLGITLVTDNADLSYNSESNMLVVLPSSKTASYMTSDSYLQVNLSETELWQIPIEVTVERCVVERLSFAEPEIELSYVIGSGVLSEDLPDVVQEPNCGQKFTALSIVDFYSDDSDLQVGVIVEESLKIEAGKISIETEDLSLAGKQVTIALSIETGDDMTALVDPLKASVSFEIEAESDNKDPGSVETEQAAVKSQQQDFFEYLVVPPITCSQADSEWQVPLTQLFRAAADGESKDLKLTLQSGAKYERLFVLSSQGDTLQIDPTYQQQLQQGFVCPIDVKKIDLSLEVQEDGNRPKQTTLTVPVAPLNLADILANSAKIQQLEIKSLDVSMNGLLSIGFNNAILPPTISVKDPQASESELDSTDSQANRMLSEQLTYELKDAISFKVASKGDEDEDEFSDKGILKASLDVVGDSTLEISLHFADPSAVSKDLLEPDTLELTFLMPELFVDSDTFKTLGSGQVNQTVTLRPQMTLEEYEELQEIAETAKKAGLAVTIQEFLLLFSVGKALKAVWVLLFCVQFIVYMSMWQIKVTDKLRIAQLELKRVTLGEFFDDLEIAERFDSIIGVEQQKNDRIAEEIGEDRFGPIDIKSSLGASFLMGSVIFVAIIILFLLCYCLCRCCSKRARALKRKVLFNPIIRYTMLSSLKFNLTLILGFSAFTSETEPATKVINILLFAFFSYLPIQYARLLYNNRGTLDSERALATYGSLFLGRNVSKADQRKRVWLGPIFFFSRRVAFICMTILLVEVPWLQCMLQQLLTMLNIVYLASDQHLFASKCQRFMEILSEMLLLMFGIVLQMNLMYPDQTELVGVTMITVFGVLAVLNVGSLIYSIIYNCKEKARQKKLTKVRALRSKQKKQQPIVAEAPIVQSALDVIRESEESESQWESISAQESCSDSQSVSQEQYQLGQASQLIIPKDGQSAPITDQALITTTTPYSSSNQVYPYHETHMPQQNFADDNEHYEYLKEQNKQREAIQEQREHLRNQTRAMVRDSKTELLTSPLDSSAQTTQLDLMPNNKNVTGHKQSKLQLQAGITTITPGFDNQDLSTEFQGGAIQAATRIGVSDEIKFIKRRGRIIVAPSPKEVSSRQEENNEVVDLEKLAQEQRRKGFQQLMSELEEELGKQQE